MAEIAEWFATYVYLPKLRDRVVLETAIRDALAKLDPKFAYAETFDEATGKYAGLLWQKAPVGPMPQTALLVRPELAVAQLRPVCQHRRSSPVRRRPTAGPAPFRRPVRDQRQTSNRGDSTDLSRSTWFGR